MAEAVAPDPLVRGPEVGTEATPGEQTRNPVVACDRCGAPMIETTCKLICTNCGGRMDCSDICIYLD